MRHHFITINTRLNSQLWLYIELKWLSGYRARSVVVGEHKVMAHADAYLNYLRKFTIIHPKGVKGAAGWTTGQEDTGTMYR